MSTAPLKLQKGWRNFFAPYTATHAVTVTYNPSAEFIVSLTRIHIDLDKLHLYVDDNLHGCNVSKWPEERRCSFLGMIEHPNSNVHVHMLWRVPLRRHHEFEVAVAKVWRRICPSGSAYVKADPDSGWARYTLKDQWGAALDNALLFVASRPARS